jgi:hypothetical protein
MIKYWKDSPALVLRRQFQPNRPIKPGRPQRPQARAGVETTTRVFINRISVTTAVTFGMNSRIPSTDPLPWLNRCESYFKGTRTMAAEQVWLASLHLDGAAMEWYYSLEREYGMLPWIRFAEFVNLRFNPPIWFNPLRELKTLQRTGTVEEYQRQFLMLLCRCDGLSPDHQMNLFTAGLSEPMTSDVEMQKPTVSATGSTTTSMPTTTPAVTTNSTKPLFH